MNADTRNKHTPGPWHVELFDYKGTRRAHVVDAEGNNACVIQNAERIVQCVNAHDALLDALQSICDSGVALAEPIERQMLDAIKLARGEG